jgi:hypothetical protein
LCICPSPLLRITRLACHHCPPLSLSPAAAVLACAGWAGGLSFEARARGHGAFGSPGGGHRTSSRTRNTTQIQAGRQHRAQIALLLLGQLAICHSHRPRPLAHRIMPAGAGGAARPPSAARLAGNGRTASPSTCRADSPIADYASESWDVRLNMGGMVRSARSRCVWAGAEWRKLARLFVRSPARTRAGPWGTVRRKAKPPNIGDGERRREGGKRAATQRHANWSFARAPALEHHALPAARSVHRPLPISSSLPLAISAHGERYMARARGLT